MGELPPSTPVLAARMSAASRAPRSFSPEEAALATLRSRFPSHPETLVLRALRAAEGHAGKAARTLRSIPAPPSPRPQDDDLAELTALHHEVASLAESFGAALPDGLHEQLESVEDQLSHVLELSEILQEEADSSMAGGSLATPERDPHPAELAAETVAEKLLRRSGDLDAAVVLACVKVGGCSIKCPATNFGADQAAMLEGVALAHCDPPLADAPLTPASAETLRGSLAVVQRGVVPVHVKAQRVQDAGAVGLILVNSDDHAWLPFVKTPAEQVEAGRTHIPIVIVPRSADSVLATGALATLLVREIEMDVATTPPAPEEHFTAEADIIPSIAPAFLAEPEPEPEAEPEPEPAPAAAPEPEPEPEPEPVVVRR